LEIRSDDFFMNLMETQEVINKRLSQV